MKAREQENKYRPKTGPAKTDLSKDPLARAKWLRTRARIHVAQARYYLMRGEDAVALASNSKLSVGNKIALVQDWGIFENEVGGIFLDQMYEKWPEVRPEIVAYLRKIVQDNKKEGFGNRLICHWNGEKLHWVNTVLPALELAKQLLVKWKEAVVGELEEWLTTNREASYTLVTLGMWYLQPDTQAVTGWLKKIEGQKFETWTGVEMSPSLWDGLLGIEGLEQDEEFVVSLIRLLKNEKEEHVGTTGGILSQQWAQVQELVVTPRRIKAWFELLALSDRYSMPSIQDGINKTILQIASPRDVMPLLKSESQEIRILGAKLAAQIEGLKIQGQAR